MEMQSSRGGIVSVVAFCGLLWSFVTFSVFLHDGLWCKVPLLWTLPFGAKRISWLFR